MPTSSIAESRAPSAVAVPSAPTPPPPPPPPAIAVDHSGDDAAAASNPATAGEDDLLPTPTEEDAIREATFRHMFGKNASGMQQGAGVYCISVGGGDTDPSPGLLARFKDVKVPVKAVSACSASAQTGVVDKTTKKRGLIFRVETIKVAGDHHHATVGGGYYEAGLSASGNIYTLERRAKGWVVTKDEMQWIS